jgi:Signal transduction histidine kinase
MPSLVGSVFQENFEKVMAERVAIEFEAVDATGKIWYDVHAYRSNGGISVFFRDISERKKSETERLTTSKLESLGTLAGGIAHDLNNILTVISGNIGLAQIEAPADSGSLLGFLSKAGQAAQHAAHLSSQLLTFSKGGAPLKKLVPMGDLLERSAEFALYGSNLRADFDIAVDLWKAEVDSGQIEQVVNALMLNAREAMPQGGTVRVRARNVVFEENVNAPLPAGRYLKVTISDRGPGISDELRAKIFDPYFTTKPTGTGLGLAISYSIVKKHGGLLLLENSSAEGSVFAFYAGH